MEIYLYEGKEALAVFNKALEDLKVTENDILYKEEAVKGTLFKSGTVKYSIVKIEEVQNFIKEFLNEILAKMSLEVKFETSVREKQINIKMYSNNNPILIGKNGQTLNALTTICKQAVYNNIKMYPYLNLDVENYKDKQIQHLERLAKNIAREVMDTKVPVIMENMNAYERRIVHNVLTDYKDITTESEGEEPNRHVVVKPKKD